MRVVFFLRCVYNFATEQRLPKNDVGCVFELKFTEKVIRPLYPTISGKSRIRFSRNFYNGNCFQNHCFWICLTPKLLSQKRLEYS